jgi:hypothetical protein
LVLLSHLASIRQLIKKTHFSFLVQKV